LKNLEFLSAISFSSGDPNVTQLAPQYILDICEPLVEERVDATLAFIHVSVKDFVQSPSSNLAIREEEVLQQHAAATLACLISGLDVFDEGYPEHSMAFRVIKGIHGLHVYATEYWTEYLLSEASRHGGISSDTCVFRLARQLANKLDTRAPSDILIGQPDSCELDERLLLLGQHQTLQNHVKRSLGSRTAKQLEHELRSEQSSLRRTSGPLGDILSMLTAYQQCVRSILSQHDFPGVSAEELELFKRQFHTSAFTCRIKSCPRATVGFDSAQLLQEHQFSHICRLRCPFPGCQNPPFSSGQALRRHEQRVHQQNQTPRPIRRVGNFGRNLPDKQPEWAEAVRWVKKSQQKQQPGLLAPSFDDGDFTILPVYTPGEPQFKTPLFGNDGQQQPSDPEANKMAQANHPPTPSYFPNPDPRRPDTIIDLGLNQGYRSDASAFDALAYDALAYDAYIELGLIPGPPES